MLVDDNDMEKHTDSLVIPTREEIKDEVAFTANWRGDEALLEVNNIVQDIDRCR